MEIIEIGKKEYHKPFWYHTCIYCGCLFTWDEDDWKLNRQVIYCPQCNRGNRWDKIKHRSKPNQKRFLDLFPLN